jgi:hypothetical protein
MDRCPDCGVFEDAVNQTLAGHTNDCLVGGVEVLKLTPDENAIRKNPFLALMKGTSNGGTHDSGNDTVRDGSADFVSGV